MSAFEWVITIGLMIVAVIMALLVMSFLGFSLIAAVLNARDEIERGDSGKAEKENDTEA